MSIGQEYSNFVQEYLAKAETILALHHHIINPPTDCVLSPVTFPTLGHH